MYFRHAVSLGVVLAAFALGGCGVQGPHIHFASASEAQLRATEHESVVWFEFRRGDEVPVAMLFAGVVEGGSAIRARASKPFWLVMRKGAPPAFSFDGETVVQQNAGSAGIALGRQSGVNQVGLVVYIGKPEDAPAGLK